MSDPVTTQATGGGSPIPPDPGSRVDTAAIRAAYAATATDDEVALMGPIIPALCDEVDRLDCALSGEELATARARAHASAWKALAKAKSAIVAALIAGREPTAAERDAVDFAVCGLRSFGINPETP